MRLAILVIAGLISITSSVQLQESTTKNCNYAVDVWWLTATPPTLSPTPEPTNEPSKSPTPDPTVFNETIIGGEVHDPDNEGRLNGKSATALSTLLLLNPYTMNECYSMNFTKEPFNQVSWKYSCKDDSTLTRQIWWDSLNCAGIDKVTTDITAAQRRVSTTFVCDQSRDCATVEISITAANTMNPTPKPTNEPTVSPTREPTAVNETITVSCSLLGCLAQNYSMLPCQCYEGCVENGDCCSDYHTECEDHKNEALDGQRSEESVQCDNTLGPKANAPTMFVWTYATNICLSLLDLSALFFEDGTNASALNASSLNYSVTSVGHIGWQCVGNSYYMAFFNGTDCSSNPIKYIQYTDDACAFGGSAWGYVECSEEFVVPTNEPAHAPIAKQPTNTPDVGCVGECGTDQVCVLSTGECQDKIVDSGCQNDAACTDDEYKCKQSDGFCYFSECDSNSDCPDGVADTSYNCETQDGEFNDIQYEYGICESVSVGDTGGVGRNGILLVIGLVFGFMPSM